MTTPGYFDAYTAAIESYPDDNVDIKILIDASDIPGTVLNQHEIATFNAELTNNGPVTMQQVQLRITGLNGTGVRFTDDTNGSFVTEIVTDIGAVDDVQHHQTMQIRPAANGDKPLQFKAPGPMTSADLVEVSLADWKANMDHINDVHSKGTTNVHDIYKDDVVQE